MAGSGASDSILVLNAGSSSIKFAVFAPDLSEKMSGLAEGIGNTPRLKISGVTQDGDFTDHRGALHAILTGLAQVGYPLTRFQVAAHRVVHGGATLTRPVRVSPEVMAQIDACAALAPLHNPHNLAAMRTLTALAPDLPQCASFDTAFHATNPDVATRYAIPETPETQGIRRYGFHGLSYASLVRAWSETTDTALPKRLLAFHLGNGASICAIRDGVSVATTMGYSPLEGLTMGTRSGGIDANAVLRMVDQHGLARTGVILNSESGLLGLSGQTSDMRDLLADPRPEKVFAVAHFCYWAVRHAGSLIAAMEGLDAIAFTGGIGENSAEIRARIVAGLGWASAELDDVANTRGDKELHPAGAVIGCWIVPAQEERMIAVDALNVLSG